MRNLWCTFIVMLVALVLSARPAVAQAPAAAQDESAQETKNQRDKELFVSEEVLSTLDGEKKKEGPEKKAKEQDKLSALEAMIADLKVPEVSKKFKPSFGSYKESMFFADNMTTLMIKTLDRTERILDAGGVLTKPSMSERSAPDAAGEQPAEVVEKVMPNLAFGAYHVSSIMYQSPKVWAVWINGERITPKRNNRKARVVGVGPDFVRLNWKPKFWEYRKQVWDDKQPLSKALQKIQAKNTSTGVDVQTKSIFATIRQNQTWVTVYPLVVEGDHQDLGVTITPQAKEVSDEEQLQGLTEQFSAKNAKNYVDKVISEKSKRKSEAGPSVSQPASGITAPPPPAAPPVAAPPASAATTNLQVPASPSPAAPNSLNDILNAVGNTPPPSGSGTINAPTMPAPVIPPAAIP